MELIPRLYPDKPIAFAPGATALKRTFPFHAPTGQLIVNTALTEEERLLQQERDKYAGMQMLRGLWCEWIFGAERDGSGTYFPLAAPQGEAIWCSAQYCLDNDKQYEWRCGYGQEFMGYSPTSGSAYRKVVDLGWLTRGLSANDLSDASPSDPSLSIPAPSLHPPRTTAAPFPRPAFGFMVTASSALQPQQLFIPCAEQPATGQPVCLLGFASKLNPGWARQYLRTEEDYEEVRFNYQHQHQRDPPDDWKLNAAVASRRAYELQDTAYFPNKLAASPGSIAAATERVVEHTCSTFPGMTGAPGVDVRAPWKLLFVHVAAHERFRCNLNYGISVNHPLFVKAYAKEVLPKVLATPASMFQPGMMQCLHHYLTVHRELLEDADVLDAVARLVAE